MKLRNFFFALLAIGSLSFLFTSCTEDEVVTPVPTNTIVDVVVGGSDFSLLEAAVVHAGLVDALKGANLTVFAPTNQAFINAGFKDEAAIKAADKTVIAAILQYHVLGSKVVSTDIKTADNQELTMLSGKKAYLTKDANGVSINAAKVTKADVAADNGVIHVIDAVIVAPSKNIVELVVGTPDLSLLKEAVVRASTGKTNVATILSGAGPFTVFAPTNKAFEAAGFNSAKIATTDPDFLATVLTYHAVAARVYSTNLKSGNVKTAEGREITVNASDATVKGGLNSTASKITAVNIGATNGVVHVIDAILLPK
jgi:uncharacterized surface protein with fasciclin (FAS1) repeats